MRTENLFPKKVRNQWFPVAMATMNMLGIEAWFISTLKCSNYCTLICVCSFYYLLFLFTNLSRGALRPTLCCVLS